PLSLSVARTRLGHGLRQPLKRRNRPHPSAAGEDRSALRTFVDPDSARRGLPHAHRRRHVNRIPLRIRLTLIFATAMAVVLATTGFLLYNHLAASLDRTLDQGLRARAADVAALVAQADTGLSDSRPGSY